MVNVDALNPNWLHLTRPRTPRSPREQAWRTSLVRRKRFCQFREERTQLGQPVTLPAVTFLTADDYHPFDTVTLQRVRDDDGEPTAWVEIEGIRDGGMRMRRVLYTQLLEHAETHWHYSHGKDPAAPMSAQAFMHCVIRAAVACLMD